MIESLIGPPAGHIPGALNHFWRTHFGSDGNFRTRGSLCQQLRDSLGILPGADPVHHCASGVPARHNVRAQFLAE